MEANRQELLHRIDRLARDLSVDHRQELRELKSEYNRVIDDTDDVYSDVRNDILDAFPCEVWIQIIKHTLPAHGYSSALLLLTMVSNKWMQALTSVPTLWTRIDLRGSQEDSLATIEVFKQLSGIMSLKVSIYVPTRHDIALIHDILAGIAPRLYEVTIRQEDYNVFFLTETSPVVSFLLRSQQCTSSVVYIHIEHPNGWPFYDRAIPRLLNNTYLPPLLRGLLGWNFLRRDFRRADNYLQNLEEIESRDPLELVISNQIQLPRLTSIKICEPSFHIPRVKLTAQDGLPQLTNLTSLTYNHAFREALLQLLTSVAPQLLYLELRIPHSKAPFLVPCLLAAKRLRKLSVEMDDWKESDQRLQTINDPFVMPVIVHDVPSLTELRLGTHLGRTRVLTDVELAYRGTFLSALIKTISILYPNAETLWFRMDPRYPTGITSILNYVSGLRVPRKLSWMNRPGHFEFSEETIREVTALEYLDTDNPEILCCLRATNLLSLCFRRGYHRKPENLKHSHVRTLYITSDGEPMVELLEDEFPSVMELTLSFPPSILVDKGSYPDLKLTSFQTLSSITILSSGFTPHATMLCLSLLYQPGNCPALNEIRFQDSSPEWNTLFLMLEKRNFMLDTSVSKIHTITLPFIPNELRAPLVSLLGGRYAERPSNEELMMGGDLELLFDENVPGCFTCLFDMRSNCREKVRRVNEDVLHFAFDPSNAIRDRFYWEADTEHADVATVEWIKQRNSLYHEFLERLDSWRKKYERTAMCYRRGDLVEITKYGVRVIVPSGL